MKTRADKVRPNHLKHRAGHVIALSTVSKERDRERLMRLPPHWLLIPSVIGVTAPYATSNGMVYSAYLHPLFRLQRDEVLSALQQVAQLVKTFGTTYSSSDLSFGSPSPPNQSDRHKEPYY